MSDKTQSEARRILGNMSRMAGYHGTPKEQAQNRRPRVNMH